MLSGKRGWPKDEIVVLGARSRPLRDLYRLLLKTSWPRLMAGLALAFLACNVLFASLYLQVGGVANATPGSFADHFFFSVQTLATIGYGAMAPTGLWAHLLVTVEALCGIGLTALSTGLVFARFAQPRSEVVFASRLCISPFEGQPTLQCRLGNDRDDVLVEPQFRVDAFRTVRTQEGQTFYRGSELTLVRDRAMSLSRTWTLLHVIDEASPLHGLTPESAAAAELEIWISVVGLDETTHQTMHARARWLDHEIAWGARPADALSTRPDGRIVLDLSRFDEVVPVEPTATFPFRWKAAG